MRRAAAAHRALGHAAAARRGRAVPRRRRRRASRRRRRRTRGRGAATASATAGDAGRRPRSAARRVRRGASAPVTWRPVTIVDARQPKALALTRRSAGRGHGEDGHAGPSIPSGPAAQGPVRTSIWTCIHPRLLELIRAHRSTLIFVNSRRLAERLAGALNELAGEPLVRSHHGSLARAAARRDRRRAQGRPAARARRHLVARARHRHGRHRSRRPDRGAAVGRQRPAAHRPRRPPGRRDQRRRHLPEVPRRPARLRGGHAGDARGRGRGDALSAQPARRARAADRRDGGDGAVAGRRPVRARPLRRRRSPTLSRRIFEGVLDMLSGRYPSDEFAELRPRVTWDRVTGTAHGARGREARGHRQRRHDSGPRPLRRVPRRRRPRAPRASASSTRRWCSSRASARRSCSARRPGASRRSRTTACSSRPRPASRARCRSGRATARRGRSSSASRSAGWCASCAALPPAAAVDRLDARARSRSRAPPRTCSSTSPTRRPPRGACPTTARSSSSARATSSATGASACCRRSAAASTPVGAGGRRARPRGDSASTSRRCGPTTGSWCGCRTRTRRRTPRCCCRRPTRSRRWSSGSSARPRCSPRVPRGRRPRAAAAAPPGRRARAALAAAQARRRPARGRGALRLVPGAPRDLPRVPARRLRPAGARRHAAPGRHAHASASSRSTRRCRRRSPRRCCSATSPTSSTTATRRWPSGGRRRSRSITRSCASCSATPSCASCSIRPSSTRTSSSCSISTRATTRRSADAVHDLLLRIGDLSRGGDRGARRPWTTCRAVLRALERSRRIVRVPIAGEPRFIAVEDAARYRDALGVPLPQGFPSAPAAGARPAGDLVLRYARTHGPFTTDECARRFGLGQAVADEVLARLAAGRTRARGRVPPGRRAPRVVRDRCAAHAAPAIAGAAAARGRAGRNRRARPARDRVAGRACGRAPGLDALLDAIEQLQGAPLPASVLEPEILPARVEGYRPADLDLLMGAGEVVWLGVEPLGERDGRIALYLTRSPARARAAGRGRGADGARAQRSSSTCRRRAPRSSPPSTRPAAAASRRRSSTRCGISSGAGSSPTTRSTPSGRSSPHRRARAATARRAPTARAASAPPAAQGRWSLVAPRIGPRPSPTEWATGIARQLLNRHGVLTREAVAAEGLRGGFSTVYEVLKTMEESGRIRRGLFVGGLGAMQFALPGALDLLRSVRDEPESPQVAHLAATDPANPYGAILKWPAPTGAAAGGARSDAHGGRHGDPRERAARRLPRARRSPTVGVPARRGAHAHEHRPRAWHHGCSSWRRPRRVAAACSSRRWTACDVGEHPLAPYLLEAGFVRGAMGFQASRESSSRGGRLAVGTSRFFETETDDGRSYSVRSG